MRSLVVPLATVDVCYSSYRRDPQSSKTIAQHKELPAFLAAALLKRRKSHWVPSTAKYTTCCSTVPFENRVTAGVYSVLEANIPEHLHISEVPWSSHHTRMKGCSVMTPTRLRSTIMNLAPEPTQHHSH